MPKERKPRLKTPGPRGPGGGSLSYPYTNYPYTPRNHHQMHGRPSSSSGKRLTCIFPSFGGWLQATPGDSTPNPSQVHPTQLSRPAHAQKPAAQHLISTTLNATKPATCDLRPAVPLLHVLQSLPIARIFVQVKSPLPSGSPASHWWHLLSCLVPRISVPAQPIFLLLG